MAQRNKHIETSWVVNFMKKSGRPCTTLELANALQVSRKDINPTLYKMQDQRIIRRVKESPPVWSLTSEGNAFRSGMGRGRGRGRARRSPTPTSQPGYNFSIPTRPMFQFSTPNTGIGHSPQPRSSPGCSPGRSPGRSPVALSGRNDLQRRLLEVLKHQSHPLTALELAHKVGLKTRKEVNPDLYGMQKEGLVAMDSNTGPPKWYLPQLQQRTQAINTSFPVGAVPVQSSKVESAPIEEEDMQTEEGFEDMETDDEEKESPLAGAQVDLSHIPEDNIRDRLLTVMEATPTSQRTDLELSKCIGGKFSRSEVRPFLEQLSKEGRVSRTAGFPTKWFISGAAGSLPQNHTPQQTISSTPPQIAMGTSTGALNAGKGLVSVATNVTDMNRNPVSALSEFCQANKMELNFTEVREFGPPHRKHFVIAAQFGGESYEAQSTSKKEARRMAADLALQNIKMRQVDMVPSSSPMVPITMETTQVAGGMAQPNTFADKIAKISHDFYNQLQCTIDAPQPGRKVIAAFIMEDTPTQNLSVVSMGSGTRCITGDHMSLQGLVVNDSHAEVVARRSLIRFFYSQLMEFHHSLSQRSENGTIFIRSERAQNIACVKDSLKFHLYISTAPCGDGAQFSRGDELNRDPPDDTTHRPTMNTKAQGVLRTKMEGGEGTIPIADETRPQTWDGIMQGGRLRTMSCSDKVGRWNVLGLQGALLTHFMEPVYMASLTLGSLHHHGHLARAVCCRFSEMETQSILPGAFHVNHPLLGRVQGGDEMKRHTEKTSQFSLNWALGDDRGELNDGGNGRPVLPPSIPKSQQAMMCSRITKARLFGLFLNLAQAGARDDLLKVKSYKEAKEAAVEFQQAKMALWKFCEAKGFGMWMRKPVEEEQFDSSIVTRLTG